MAEQKNEEKRAYVRADLTTQVKVQPVSREAFEHHKAMRVGGLSGDVVAEDGGRMGHLFDRLNRIEEKLDRILEKLDPESGSAEETSYGTAQNISGAGVNLILEDAYDVGQLVLISLSVPGFSIGFLQAYGEVVRVTPHKGTARPSFETSIKFLIISEDEREKLIGYAFQVQRQTIRDSLRAKERAQGLPGHGR
jgi:c-di-GMP-binding flagellar brake protein YcgR